MITSLLLPFLSVFRVGVLLAMITSLLLPFLSVFRVCLYPSTYLPDFMTNASLALIDSLLGRRCEPAAPHRSPSVPCPPPSTRRLSAGWCRPRCGDRDTPEGRRGAATGRRAARGAGPVRHGVPRSRRGVGARVWGGPSAPLRSKMGRPR